MKFSLIATALMFIATTSFAGHHEQDKKKAGHDKEHSHVQTDKVDHAHDDAHHMEHDHKAHHPDHKEETVKKKK